MRPIAVMRARGAAGGGGPSDPFYAYVVSVLNMDGADGSTTFTDAKGRTWTRNGNTQIDTSQGFNAAQFDGAGDWLYCDGHTSLKPGTADFCIEVWAKFNSNSFAYTELMDFRPWMANGEYIAFGVTPTKLGLYTNSADLILDNHGGNILSLNHFALIRHAGTTFLAANGTKLATSITSDTRNYVVGSSRPLIGANAYDPAGQTNSHMNGWLKGSRITIGTSRYGGANFTPDTAPFPTA